MSRHRAASIGALVGLLLATPLPAAPVDLQLPEQPLILSLRELAKVSGLTLVVDETLVEGRVAPALSERLEPQDAAKRLLAGTSLSAVTPPDATTLEVVAVIAVGAGASASLPGDSASEDGEVDTIVVTGELLRREAQRTTTSVAVTTGAQIERSVARDVYDVIRATPNASFNDSDLGYGSITLRGISSYGIGAVQNIALYSSATAIVLDGVALPRSAMAYSDLSAFDLAQVEIFRGPQSTSQGRNAMAGAVIINTVEPEVENSFSPEVRGRFGGGSDSAYQGAGAFGATLWPDKLAVRVVTDHRAADGDIRNVTRDEDDWAREASHGTRLRVKVTPFGVDGRYQALLGVNDLRRFTGNRYVEQERESDRVATSEEPSFIDSDSRLFSLDQRLRLGEDWTLRAVSAYVRSNTHMYIDTDYAARNDGYLEQFQKADAFSQELRATFDFERWRGSFGAYYFDGHDGDRYFAQTALAAFVGGSDFCQQAGICGPLIGNILSGGESPANIEDMAVFGEADWRATERLTLTAGLRLDRERNNRTIVAKIEGDQPVGQAVLAFLRGAGTIGPDGTFPVSRSFTAVLPKVAASYEIFDGWFAGLAYTEGYRPGGDSYNYGSGRSYSFDSERTRNYEVSFKGTYVPWRATVALNLFHTDWDDMQVTVGVSPDTYISNAGTSRIDGGELELAVMLLDRLRLIGGVGITDGRFRDFDSANGDFSGKPLPKAPDYSGIVALEWSPMKRLMLRPDVQFAGPSSAQPDNAPNHRISEYTLVNLSLRWQIGPIGLFFSGNNLTDKQYRTDASNFSVSRLSVASLGYGRRLLGGLELQF